MAAYYWVDTQSRGLIPSTALRGGHDVDGAEIFVGRAFHEGDWIPAKVIPARQIAYIAYGGDEIPVHKFQVLCEQQFDWVPAQGGQVPEHAVIGGKTSDGENLYIGRAFHNGSHTVGKVLCEQQFDWVPAQGGQVPEHAVIGGKTSDGENLYIGRAFHNGSHTVGKVHPSHGTCYIPFDGKEVAHKTYEILVLRP